MGILGGVTLGDHINRSSDIDDDDPLTSRLDIVDHSISSSNIFRDPFLHSNNPINNAEDNGNQIDFPPHSSNEELNDEEADYIHVAMDPNKSFIWPESSRR